MTWVPRAPRTGWARCNPSIPFRYSINRNAGLRRMLRAFHCGNYRARVRAEKIGRRSSTALQV